MAFFGIGKRKKEKTGSNETSMGCDDNNIEELITDAQKCISDLNDSKIAIEKMKKLDEKHKSAFLFMLVEEAFLEKKSYKELENDTTITILTTFIAEEIIAAYQQLIHKLPELTLEKALKKYLNFGINYLDKIESKEYKTGIIRISFALIKLRLENILETQRA